MNLIVEDKLPLFCKYIVYYSLFVSASEKLPFELEILILIVRTIYVEQFSMSTNILINEIVVNNLNVSKYASKLYQLIFLYS